MHVIERESARAGGGGRKRDDVPGRGAKVFAVVWDANWGIASGGEDKIVQINRGRDLVSASG